MSRSGLPSARLLLILLATAAGVSIVVACSSDDAATEAPDAGSDAPTSSPDAIAPPPDAAVADGGDAAPDGSFIVAPSPISSFDTFTCLDTGAGIKCWGAGNVGQLGDGTTPANSPAPRLVSGVGLTGVASGAAASCARVDGGAACWGRSAYGQLGYDPSIDIDAGRTCNTAPCSTTPTRVPGLSGVEQLGAGFLYSCALVTGGTVSCWGLNDTGKVGIPPGDGGPAQCSGNPCVLAPTAVPSVAGVVQIALASDTTCVLHGDGTIACWGANYAGTMGLATADAGPDAAPVDVDPHPPSTVPGITDARYIALGAGGHACAVHADHTVSCWGRGGFGQTGRPPSKELPCPYSSLCSVEIRKVPGLTDVREIALGASHSCAITTSDAVVCWGNNSVGQLGHDPAIDVADAGSTYSPSPMTVALPPAAHLAAGTGHTCALLKDGTVRCWGRNADAELGLDAGGSTFVPTQVNGL